MRSDCRAAAPVGAPVASEERRPKDTRSLPARCALTDSVCRAVVAVATEPENEGVGDSPRCCCGLPPRDRAAPRERPADVALRLLVVVVESESESETPDSELLLVLMSPALARAAASSAVTRSAMVMPAPVGSAPTEPSSAACDASPAGRSTRRYSRSPPLMMMKMPLGASPWWHSTSPASSSFRMAFSITSPSSMPGIWAHSDCVGPTSAKRRSAATCSMLRIAGGTRSIDVTDAIVSTSELRLPPYFAMIDSNSARSSVSSSTGETTRTDDAKRRSTPRPVSATSPKMSPALR